MRPNRLIPIFIIETAITNNELFSGFRRINEISQEKLKIVFSSNCMAIQTLTSMIIIILINMHDQQKYINRQM